MSLSKEQINAIVVDEEARWARIHAAIIEEAIRAKSDMHSNRKVARELTSEMVACGRNEDKVQLASDEAVAHGLSKLRRNISEDFEVLAEQPYFARVITKEQGKEVEFLLSTSSFTKCRIVDWRKAPISQLYYNYKQGDEFEEVIQKTERYGVIKLRRGYKGIQNELHVIELPEGIIRKENGEWIFEEQKEILSRSARHDGHLPPILSLITKEQYNLISHAAKKPVVVQGIAGSGKTTVALHRLAWMLHKDNSDIDPNRCMVVVFNRALKIYIENTLPELGIKGVSIRTYHQWLANLAKHLGGGWPYNDFSKIIESEQFKSSPICLDEINKYVLEFPDYVKGGYREDLFKFYHYLSNKDIFWPSWKKISEGLRTQAKQSLRDQQDDSVLLNLVFAREGHYPIKQKNALNRCDHIVIDEAQDFGVIEVRALLGALDVDRTVTIVGDAAQKIIMNRHFGSWEELLREAGFSETTPIALDVSHRSTAEIMSIASHIRKDISTKLSSVISERHGPEPTILFSNNYEAQIRAIGKWIQERIKANPHSLSAVICRWPKQAEKLTAFLKKMGYPFVRWGYRENFDFSPGVTITNVHQVKGLEFRNVLIVDPVESHYSAEKEDDRNLLYVAVTRAEVQLDFVSCEKPTNILPDILKRRL